MKEQVISGRNALHEQRRNFEKRSLAVRLSLDTQGKETELFLQSAKEERIRLNGLIDSVKLARESLRVEQAKINDDRAKLATAMKIWQTQTETTTE
jgi:hypothetical protein